MWKTPHTRRNLAGQPVRSQPHTRQAPTRAQTGRYLPGELVPEHQQLLQLAARAETRRNPTGETVGGNVKPPQRSRLPQTVRQFPGEFVPEHLKLIKVGRVSNARRQLPSETVLVEVETLERQTTQLIGNAPTQMVHGNIKEPQRSEVGDSFRQFTGERVVVQLNLLDSGDASERTGDGSIEVVGGQIQDSKAFEVPKGVGYGADEIAGAEPERFEVGEVAEGGRNGGRMEGVVGEVERFEGGDVEERRRKDVVEEVEYEGESLEVLEGSEGGGNGAGEVVAGEVEVAEAGEEGEGVGEGAGEEVLGEVEVEERGAEGYLEREGLVDGVVEEDDGG